MSRKMEIQLMRCCAIFRSDNLYGTNFLHFYLFGRKVIINKYNILQPQVHSSPSSINVLTHFATLSAIVEQMRSSPKRDCNSLLSNYCSLPLQGFSFYSNSAFLNFSKHLGHNPLSISLSTSVNLLRFLCCLVQVQMEKHGDARPFFTFPNTG